MIFKTKKLEEEPKPEPKPQKPLFKVFVEASNWTPADGPEPGIFLDRPPGHRCIWSVKWGSVHGLVLPGDLVDLADATPLQVLHEASDVSQRGNTEVGKLLMTVTPDNSWKTLAELRHLLAQERFTYPEFISDCLPPARQFLGMLKVRDGWGTADQIFAKSMEV